MAIYYSVSSYACSCCVILFLVHVSFISSVILFFFSHPANMTCDLLRTAGLATAGVFSLLVLLTWPSSGASSPSSLLEFVVPDVEPRARISFLPMHMLPELETELETDTYPPTYNNHKLRAAACFGFEHTVSAARPVPWTPDGQADCFHAFYVAR